MMENYEKSATSMAAWAGLPRSVDAKEWADEEACLYLVPHNLSLTFPAFSLVSTN